MQVVEATRNDPVQVLPSEWVKFAFDMPQKGRLRPFSFRKREYLIPIYDRPDRHILLMFGRQSEKSTTLGNKLLALMALLPYYKVLYVSPSQTQTRKFSQDRIAQPLVVSPRLRELVGAISPDNIHQKVFVRNQSSIELRYAFLNPDRVRGVPADHLVIDELQDVFIDSVPVLEETLSASDRPTHAGWKTMAGTPKSLDNTMAHYWSLSTQSELVIPCERHGETNRPGTWHWIIAGEANIGKKGMICEKCGNLVNRYHPLRGWVDTVPGAKIRGYRLPQILAPYVKDSQWDEKIIYKYNSYGRAQFLNEVLAIPWEQGVRPITQGEIMSCCDPDWKMTREQMKDALRWYTQREVFAGIDYGCHDDQTRVLTRDGFKFFRDLTMDDYVAQFDEKTREMTFVHPTAITVKEIDSSLYHFVGRGVDMMLTSDHRMLARGAAGGTWGIEPARVTAARRSDVELRGYVTWKGVERSTFTLPGIPSSSGYAGSADLEIPMDAWLEFLGYAISEGGVCTAPRRGKNAVLGRRPVAFRITQRGGPGREWRIEKIRSCLRRTGLRFFEHLGSTPDDYQWDISGKQVWSWISTHVGVTSSSKRIPREFLGLSSRQLRILFDALIFGDGTVNRRPRCSSGSYYSTSRLLCEDVQELAIRLGLRAVVSLHKPELVDEKGYLHKARYRVTWSRGRDHHLNVAALRRIDRVPYKGRVYCCTVPTGLIVTERNGKIAFQGNTGENSWTVVALGAYVQPTVFKIFYLHRFTGRETSIDIQTKLLLELLTRFNVLNSFGDYGIGYQQNDVLTRERGARRHHILQYVASAKRKIYYNPSKGRWIGERDDLMSAVLNAIKARKIQFPSWDVFAPFGQDILNITAEFNEARQRTVFSHHPEKPDDSFHAILYCLMAASLVTPRPDIWMSITRSENPTAWDWEPEQY
ncbi:MAG: hypothetical protein GYA36_19815 [Veillonellaceae bacterium]|nr:hypothetical protein [Veillonellaceae bacterium]